MKKLDMRGFSHDVLLVVFVVIFAISGVAYLVASKAATCSPVSGAVSQSVSSPVSGEDCSAVSGPVSTPVTPPQPPTTPKSPDTPAPSFKLSCIIQNLPARPATSQLIRPAAVITNNGSQGFRPDFKNSFNVYDATGKQRGSNTYIQTTGVLMPGKSARYELRSYKVPAYITKGVYNISSVTGKFNCSASFTR